MAMLLNSVITTCELFGWVLERSGKPVALHLAWAAQLRLRRPRDLSRPLKFEIASENQQTLNSGDGWNTSL
jgi:hypothetical protein